jgi:serine/alanine adding enzyme
MGALLTTAESSTPATVPAPTPTEQAVVSLAADGLEWDAYVVSRPNATADHLWGWREIFSATLKQRPEYLIAHRGSRVVGVLPLVLFNSWLFGRFAVSVPFLNYGGLLADDGPTGALLVAEATRMTKAFGGTHLELRHQERQLPGVPCRMHKIRMLLDLPATSESLWAAIDRKVRNQVRKAQKESLTTAVGGAELLDEFYSVFARNMRDLGTPVHGRQLFERVLAVFGGAATIHLVRHGAQPAAAALTLRFRDTVIVPWASSVRELRHLCPNMLLYWSMLEHSVTAGAREFDFGRSTRGAGTHQFKAQWGAAEIPLHWEYVLLARSGVPDQGPAGGKVGLATTAWKRLPVAWANLLGPSLIRQIP